MRVEKTRYRILYFVDEERTAVLLHGFTKATAAVEEADKKIGRTRNGPPRGPAYSQEPFQIPVRNVGQVEKAQMKTAWDSYLDQQLAKLARLIGTSTPQLSRTERRPET